MICLITCQCQTQPARSLCGKYAGAAKRTIPKLHVLARSVLYDGIRLIIGGRVSFHLPCEIHFEVMRPLFSFYVQAFIFTHFFGAHSSVTVTRARWALFQWVPAVPCPDGHCASGRCGASARIRTRAAPTQSDQGCSLLVLSARVPQQVPIQLGDCKALHPKRTPRGPQGGSVGLCIGKMNRCLEQIQNMYCR